MRTLTFHSEFVFISTIGSSPMNETEPEFLPFVTFMFVALLAHSIHDLFIPVVNA
jgi:hypothetical protein